MSRDLRRTTREFGLAMERERPADEEVALVRRRIHSRLKMRQRAARLGVLVPAGAAAAAVALWLVWPVQTTWSVSDDPGGCASLGSGSLLSSKGCASPITVSRNGDQIRLSPDSSVVLRGERQIQMRRGRAHFSITPHKGGDRFRVRVDVGTIEVIGTRFGVWQDEGFGGVEVTSGTVALTLDSGESEVVRAGAVRRWTSEPETASETNVEETAEPETADSSEPRRRPGPSRKEASKRRIKELLSHQFQLRAQRRYDEALHELRAAFTDSAFSRNQKSRLSLEIGRVLEQRGDTTGACQHWRRHARVFGKGSLDSDAARFLARCR